MKVRPGKILGGLLLLATLVVVGGIGVVFLRTALSIEGLLTENKKLQEAIENLSIENQIGYARVVDQFWEEGELQTTVRFVETDRDDPEKRIREIEFTVSGDVVHFDALIVKFATPLVRDGKERAIYLWRRVYGENQTPASGPPISTFGEEPARYSSLLHDLEAAEESLFWEQIWNLAVDPDRLSDYGVEAVYGNVVYNRLQPGFVYRFRINNLGQVFPEREREL